MEFKPYQSAQARHHARLIFIEHSAWDSKLISPFRHLLFPRLLLLLEEELPPEELRERRPEVAAIIDAAKKRKAGA